MRELNTSLCPSCITDSKVSYHSETFEKNLMLNNKKVITVIYGNSAYGTTCHN